MSRTLLLLVDEESNENYLIARNALFPGFAAASNCLIALVNLVIDALDYYGQVQSLRILVELVGQRSSLGFQFFLARF